MALPTRRFGRTDLEIPLLSLGGMRFQQSWTDLPALAIKYVRRIEELLQTQVSLLSTSPKRDDTILVRNPFID